MLTGVLGFVSGAAFTRAETQRTAASAADHEGSSTQQRATVAAPHHDHGWMSLDLTAVTPDALRLLLAALMMAATVALAAGQRRALPAGRASRAPPLH